MFHLSLLLGIEKSVSFEIIKLNQRLFEVKNESFPMNFQ